MDCQQAALMLALAARRRAPDLPPLQPSHWRSPNDPLESGLPTRICSDDLQEAALRGDLGLVRRLVQAGASVNAPIRALGDDEYMTLPHMLASKPEIPNGARILQELIDSRANPNVRSSRGSTPLMFACVHQNVGAVEVLLGCGSHMEPVDDQGHTALRYSMLLDPQKPATEGLSSEIARLLCESMADPDHGGDVPPITEAVLQGNSTGAETLLELGATSDGLYQAVTYSPLPFIQMLVDNEANPFVRDESGKTVMEAALARGDDDITTMLRDYIGNLERSRHPHLATRLLDEESLENAAKIRRRKTGSVLDSLEGLSCWAKLRMGFQQHVRQIYKGVRFQILMFAVLLLALFLPDLWVITSATNTEALDAILLGILAGFLLEFVLQLIGEWSTYFLTFSFWMDIIGIMSVPLDHSYVTELVMSNVDLDGATLARATKIVKLSVRSIRFSRLLKLIRFLPEGSQNTVGSTAKRMAGILGKKVTLQVSCLIIMTVIMLPTLDFFMFPIDDNSMLAWVTMVHRAYSEQRMGDLSSVLVDFEDFYRQLSYFPYEVHLLDGNRSSVLNMHGQVPERKEDRMKVQLGLPNGSSGTYIYFNFQEPNRTESICNCLLIATIILIMFTSASLVTSSVSRIVLVPLERLLSVVQSIAGEIFTSVTKMCGSRSNRDDDEEVLGSESGEGDFGDETKLISKVLKKLEALSQITARRMPIDDFEELDEDQRALLLDYAVPRHSPQGKAKQIKRTVQHIAPAFEEEDDEWVWEKLEDDGLERESLGQWDFHVPELADAQQLTLCCCLLLLTGGSSMHGNANSRTKVGMEGYARCHSFVGTVSDNYARPENVRYHNFMHAADVTFTMYHCLSLIKAEHFMGVHERFALVVSSIAHDIGHPGYSNAFLVETSQELAVRYNDVSPLENMHSARLFQIVSVPGTNVFANLSRAQYAEVRKVCIDSILGTDSQRHYQLLSELQVTYEQESDLFDSVMDAYNQSPEEYPPSELVDFYCRTDARKLIRSSFLHFVDTAHAMKPWRMCKYWSELLFEEFFSQGDTERAMGLPVQPLNDRGKVNKPQVQLAFTEFFVAPLASVISKWMPPLRLCEDQCLENLDRWMRRWFDMQPSHVEQDRVVERISRMRSGTSMNLRMTSHVLSLRSSGL